MGNKTQAQTKLNSNYSKSSEPDIWCWNEFPEQDGNSDVNLIRFSPQVYCN